MTQNAASAAGPAMRAVRRVSGWPHAAEEILLTLANSGIVLIAFLGSPCALLAGTLFPQE